MNTEKTIIAQYMITIYDNGDMETTRLTVDEQKELASKKENFIDCNIISGGTAQLLLIIKKVVEADDEWLAALDTEEEFEPDIYASIRYAIRDVSKLNGLNPMTVTNKVTRDLKDKNGESISMAEFQDMVSDYLKWRGMAAITSVQAVKNADCELIQAAYRSAAKRFHANNLEAIGKFFMNPRIDFLLKNGKTV